MKLSRIILWAAIAIMFICVVAVIMRGQTPEKKPVPLKAEQKAEIWKSRETLARMALEFQRLQTQMETVRTKYQTEETKLRALIAEFQKRHEAKGYDLDSDLEWIKPKPPQPAGGNGDPVGSPKP